MKTLSATLAALALLLAGCAPSHQHPITLRLVIDGSDRTPGALLRVVSLGFRCTEMLRREDHFEFLVLGHGCEMIYRGNKPATRRAFNALVLHKLMNNSDALWVPGTRIDTALDMIAQPCNRSGTVACIVTDGGYEDRSSSNVARITTTLRSLGRRHTPRLLLVGVAPEHVSEWSQSLSAAGLGSDAVCGQQDDMAAVEAAIDQARRTVTR